MEINLLVLNLGNSRLGIAVFSGGELEYATRLPHAQRADWPAAIREAWRRIADRAHPSVAAAGVNPPLVEPLEQAVRDATGGQHVQWVGRELDLPIKVLTDAPE